MASHRPVHTNDEVSEHPWTQFIFGVGNLRADSHSVCIGINRRVDLRNLALEHAIGIGHHPDLDRLAQVKKRDVTLDDIRQHPFHRDIRDGVRCCPVPRLHQQPRRRVERGDLAGNGTTDDECRVDLARGDHLINLSVGLAEDANGIPCGLESAICCLLIGNCLFQLFLRNTNVRRIKVLGTR